MMLALAPWLYHSSAAHKLKTLQADLASTRQAQQRLLMDLQKTKKDYAKMSKEQKQQEAINNELLAQLHAKGAQELAEDAAGSSAAYLEAHEMEQKYLGRIQELESALSKKSAGMAIVKYGNGPYHVVVTLAQEPAPGVGKSFMLETVPITAMPLSIGHFLRLVEHQFYDHLALLHRHDGTNVIQSTEHVVDTKHSTKLDDNELHRLAFSERNNAHPLKQYSVAFEGMGPNFVIVMDKKSKSDMLTDVSAFATVIQGQAVLQAMIETKPDKPSDMFTIESMRILPPDN